MKIILASSSTTRCELFNRLQLDFTSISPKIDESPQLNESAKQLASRLAQEKTYAVAKQHPDALIIGSDQCCQMEEHIFGKPQNHDAAVQQLSLASGKNMIFYTSFAIYHPELDALITHQEKTQVYFRTLTQHEIIQYLMKENVSTCAGSFKCEGLGITLFKRIEQTDPTALLGLPLISLNHCLITLGINPLFKK